MYFVLLVSIAFFVGVVGVVSNPSPCFGSLFLVLASGIGCVIVAEMGSSFPALILFMVYLGGMLVVFAYSVSLCVDLYPGVFVGRFVLVFIVFFVIVAQFELGNTYFGDGGFWLNCHFGSDFLGVPLLYTSGGYNLLFVGFGLLLTLIVVLELVRGISFVSQKTK
uniref:NADH-ubiquinone oxidoreductase chain 6 n=1 Tax=Xenagama taylori TaxID=330728 RepID=Q1G7J2_9SAUR|nr:NADH dehydrogenase subunit 6 [Xenagama taylori]AAY57829.1 NADH dehydrogenase subunit 6 [Xenagama taylori]